MDRTNFILCGLGGQGILFMTKVLSQASLTKGFTVMGAETHGMAQRGGSVISHLRLGDVAGTLVRTGTAHFILALNEVEGYRNLPFLAEGSALFMNADTEAGPREEIREYLAERNIQCRSVAASHIARESGSSMSTNLALLGFFSAFVNEPINFEDQRSTIERISPERFRKDNCKVFDAGFERGMKGRG